MSLIMGSSADQADFSDDLLAAISGHSINDPVINAAGTGYTVGDTLTVVGGTSTITATLEVVTITGGGGTGPIGTMRMINCGVYTATPSITANAVTGGTGSAATVDLTYFDNGWVSQRSQQTDISAAVISAAGTGYAVNDVITLDGGTWTTQATLTVATITGGGGTGPIGTVTISEAGDYQVLPANPVAQASVAPAGGSGATFTLTWGAGDKEVIVKSLGGGTDAIYCGWRTYFHVANDYYNLELAGMVGYDSALPFGNQPGVSHGRHEGGTDALEDGSYLICTSVSFNYFINVTPYRIIITVAIGSNYFHAYMGWGNRFGTASEFPYPLIISGASDQYDLNTTTISKISSITDPWAAYSNALYGPMQIYGADGAWYGVHNRKAANGQTKRVVIPAQAPAGVIGVPSEPQDRFMSDNEAFSDIIFSISSGTGGAVNSNLLATEPNDDRLMLPCLIVFSDPAAMVMYEIDDCFWCTAFGGVTSEDRFINAAGEAYRVFKNGNRTDNYAFLAIKE